METKSGSIISVVLSLVLILVASSTDAQITTTCTTKAFVGSSCNFTVDQAALLSTSPTGPTISCSGNGNGTKTCTVHWNDNGTYAVGIKPEPDQPIETYITVTVYYAVGRPTVTGPSLVCASTSGSDYSATTSNDDNVHDFTWAVSPSNAFTSLSTTGSPDNANLHVNWNSSYTGLVTITSTSYGYGEDQLDKNFSVNRHAMETFTANLSTPEYVCEGVPFNLFAEVSHFNTTYQWFREDDSTPFSTSQTAPATPLQNTFYRLKVTPSASNDCLTSYATIIRQTNTGSINFHVTPRLNSIDITNSIALRCNGGGSMDLTLSADGWYSHTSWSITSDGSVSPGSSTGSVLSWNSAFVGTATLKVDVTGCNGVLSDQMDISVVQAPSHKSLFGTSSPICPNTTTPVSLSNLGAVIPETYELIKVNNPGPAETVISMSTTTSSGWNLGPGTYYVSTTAPNCPTDVTDRLVINPLIHNPIYQSSAGTLAVVAGTMTLTVCEATGVNLTVSEATNLKWYRYNDVCLSNSLVTIPPMQRWEFCHKKFTKPDGTTYDGSTELPFYAGAVSMITVGGEDDVCHQVFEKDIRVKTTAGVRFIGINPTMTARVTGSGTTSFEMEYHGILQDQEWQITPATAGTISPIGTVTWAPSFTSYENGVMTQPVTINARTKGCEGWEDHPYSVSVVPILDYDENRIRTMVAQDTMRLSETVLDNMDDPFKVKISAAFFDGLGRNVQNVQYFSSTPNKDVLELKVYDEFGREAVKNLPFAIEHSFNYSNDAINQQVAYYDSPPVGVPADASPFVRTVFEASPLNRVIEQGAPGAAWQPGTGNTVTKEYLVNAASEILKFSYDPTTFEISLAQSLPNPDAFYDANTLTCTKTIDEHHNDVLEYVDKEGRTICKKVKADTGVYASTYYIYDDFGNLVVVLPPEAVKKFTGN